MEVKVESAIQLLSVLNSCDSYEIAAKNGDQDRVIKVFYPFSFDARFKVAMNVAELEKVLAIYNASRDSIIQRLAANGVAINVAEEKEAIAAFMKEDRAIREEKVLVSLEKLTKQEVENAKLPSSIIAGLMPIIEK